MNYFPLQNLYSLLTEYCAVAATVKIRTTGGEKKKQYSYHTRVSSSFWCWLVSLTSFWWTAEGLCMLLAPHSGSGYSTLLPEEDYWQWHPAFLRADHCSPWLSTVQAFLTVQYCFQAFVSVDDCFPPLSTGHYCCVHALLGVGHHCHPALLETKYHHYPAWQRNLQLNRHCPDSALLIVDNCCPACLIVQNCFLALHGICCRWKSEWKINIHATKSQQGWKLTTMNTASTL